MKTLFSQMLLNAYLLSLELWDLVCSFSFLTMDTVLSGPWDMVSLLWDGYGVISPVVWSLGDFLQVDMEFLSGGG